MGFRKAFPTLQSSLFFCFYGYSKIGHSSFEISWPCATPLHWTRPFLSFTFFALICSVLVPFLAVYPEWGCLLEGSPGGSGWAPEARALQHLQTFSSRLLQGHSSASKLRPELSTQYLLPIWRFSSSQAPFLPFSSSYRQRYLASFVAGHHQDLLWGYHITYFCCKHCLGVVFAV